MYSVVWYLVMYLKMKTKVKLVITIIALKYAITMVILSLEAFNMVIPHNTLALFAITW